MKKITGISNNGRRYQLRPTKIYNDYRIILEVMYNGIFKTENVFISDISFEKALQKAEKETGIKIN